MVVVVLVVLVAFAVMDAFFNDSAYNLFVVMMRYNAEQHYCQHRKRYRQ